MREPAARRLDDSPTQLSDATRAAIAASARKVVAIDDDPTGVQTVHDIAVLADWSAPMLADELANDRPAFFILTNSRSMPPAEARAVNAEIAHNLLVARRESGVDFVVASRSDSTLRGHFPDETDALTDRLGPIDAVVLCPAFFEGGRVTIDDVHYVREDHRPERHAAGLQRPLHPVRSHRAALPLSRSAEGRLTISPPTTDPKARLQSIRSEVHKAGAAGRPCAVRARPC